MRNCYIHNDALFHRCKRILEFLIMVICMGCGELFNDSNLDLANTQEEVTIWILF